MHPARQARCQRVERGSTPLWAAKMVLWAMGLHGVVACLASRNSGGIVTHMVHQTGCRPKSGWG